MNLDPHLRSLADVLVKIAIRRLVADREDKGQNDDWVKERPDAAAGSGETASQAA